jgi:hypothetical protein
VACPRAVAIGTGLAIAIKALAARHGPHAGSLAGEIRINEARFMRKLINTLVVGIILGGIGLVLPGCTDETGTKQETKITTPEGTTTERREIKVDKSGKAPPSLPSEKPNP